jgi:type I restriction enzyme S subunit
MFTSIASIGKIGIANESLLTNQQINSISVYENEANYLFIYNLLKYITPYFKSITGGVATPIINKTAFEKVKLTVPDIHTQTRIAEILSAYDDLIENNNKRIALLEKAAQELYKEWFVRFRFPDHENTKFVNGLPERWEVKRLGQIFNITSSKRIFLSDYVSDGVPFYRSREIIQLAHGDSSLNEELFISQEKYNEITSRFGVPQKNDILITSVGTIGETWLVDGHKFYFKDGNLTWIQSSANAATALILFLWLNSFAGKNALLSSTIGTSQSALTIENLKRIKMLVPTSALQERFFKMVSEMVMQKRVLRQQNQNLIKQRDLLLPRLMSGKLEVSNA